MKRLRTTRREVPSALLSRDPVQFSSTVGVSLSAIIEVSASVSVGIICDKHGGHGCRAANNIKEVNKFCLNDVVHNEDGAVKRMGMNTRSRPMIVGAVTALDTCARALMQKEIGGSKVAADVSCKLRSRGKIDCIQTGSAHFDRLLAPDEAHFLFTDGWGLPRPYKLYCTVGNPSSSFCQYWGGVPFGMVTEISGPPFSGKTQLALSIAAHAVIKQGLRVHYLLGGCCGSKALSRRLHAMILKLVRVTLSSAVNESVNVGFQGDSQSNITNGEKVGSILAKAMLCVEVTYITDAHSLLATLAQIDHDEEVSFHCCKGGSKDKGTLIIIDSVSGCLGHHLSSESGTALTSQVALTLHQMARTHNFRLTANDSMRATCQPRKFAVVLTNGSVAMRRPSFCLVKELSSAKSIGKHFQKKPAMVRYWRASDIILWLQIEESPLRDIYAINFYNSSPVFGLSFLESKVICVGVQKHYGKSSKKNSSNLVAKICIQSYGICDV